MVELHRCSFADSWMVFRDFPSEKHMTDTIMTLSSTPLCLDTNTLMGCGGGGAVLLAGFMEVICVSESLVCVPPVRSMGVGWHGKLARRAGCVFFFAPGGRVGQPPPSFDVIGPEVHAKL